MRILYVEDNEDAREQTIKLLKNYFCDITVAKNGKDGLEKFKESFYHIVFSDIEMPVMDGIEMIEHIREIDKEIPIVIFSAYEKKEYFLKTIKVGIDGYILKPYNFKEVLETIKKLVVKFDIEVKTKYKIILSNGFIWDKKYRNLTKDGKNIKLTKSEIKLLEILSIRKDSIMKSGDIEETIFGAERSDNKRVRNLISRLQLKLGKTIIESHYASGYKLI